MMPFKAASSEDSSTLEKQQIYISYLKLSANSELCCAMKCSFSKGLILRYIFININSVVLLYVMHK